MSQHGGGGFISEAIKVIERLCMKVNIEALTQAKGVILWLEASRTEITPR